MIDLGDRVKVTMDGGSERFGEVTGVTDALAFDGAGDRLLTVTYDEGDVMAVEERRAERIGLRIVREKR